MSDIMLNVVSTDDNRRRKTSEHINDKHKRFVRKRRGLERRGFLRAKQNNPRKGQSNHGQTPWQNGAKPSKAPPAAAATQSSSSPHAPKCSGAVNSAGCRPSASTNSSAPFAFTVRNNPGQSNKTANLKSPAAAASSASAAPRSCKPGAAALPSGSRPLGNPTKYLAIDCEMVGTGPKGCVSQLARCSIVSYEGDVVYDKFIKPSDPVTDYRTRWSGIRWSDLTKATPYVDARKEILRLLVGKVVIGHAIHNDFKVLGYSHPASLTRDTSRSPLLNQKAGFSDRECASLKRLTKAIFNRDIQTGRKGHCSVEDAKATMELYKVVEAEWEAALASKP
ncbi:interferon-stimulated 20 kDa exonuclease-like 2 [Diretmus argenteus]